MQPPTLNTDRYVLKPYSLEDEDRFIEIAVDELSIQFMGGSTGNEAEERKLFKKILDIYNKNVGKWFWLWGIYKNNLLCGHLEMKETEHTNEHELEIVYMAHPDERRKGMMTEVLSLLKQQQKNWSKRIIATVSHKNINSIALLEKWGIEKREVITDSEGGEYLKLTLDQ